MRLRTRLLLFFQGALALVLVGFSCSLYLLASKYLHRQADERLEAALNTLTAAAEVNENGIEWEPHERALSFGRRAVEGGFLWRVTDGRGRLIDGSAPGPAGRILDEPVRGSESARRPSLVRDDFGGSWRVLHRRLESPTLRRDDPSASDGAPAGKGRTHDSLRLSAAVALDGVHKSLGNLALVLVGLSAGLWAATLALGGRLCRRALRPVTKMADAAHAIAGDDFGERLPVPASGDELEGLGRAINGLLDRLHEANERQRRFTGDASHQLRTPLTAMQGQVDLALRQERSGEEYRTALAVVQRKARHLRRIVEALLFLARADAESQRPRLEPVEMSGWLREYVASRTGPRTDDMRLAPWAGGPAWVRVQPTLLGELLDNLLDNAGKYSEPGTPIVVILGRSGGSLRVAVEDCGIGMDEGEIPHITDPFYRTAQARSRDSRGLGLGLSVAARIASTFGGRLDVESRPGRGSTFTLVLPVSDTAETSPMTPTGDVRAEAGVERS